jgi:predicted dienelactone hydrolase
MKHRAILPFIAALAVLLLLACGTSDTHRSAASILQDATQRGPYGVGVTTINLDDTSRPTAANHDFPASNDRKITLEVWYPTAPAAGDEDRDVDLDAGHAPYPLIILSHGLSATRRLYSGYGRHLASHGYVIAAPDYPLSNLASPGGPRLTAVLEQPKDLSFVIDKMLEFNGAGGNRFKGAIDPDRIGATGHSLGAMTTFMGVYGPDRDERIKAALPFETPGCFFPESYVGDASVPILFTSGSDDLITPPVSATHVYDIANAPRYLVTIKGADHTRFSEVDIPDTAIVGAGILQNLGGGDFTTDAISVALTLGRGGVQNCGLGETPGSDPLLTADRQREILRTIETVFFDGYLRGDKDSVKFLSDGLATSIPEVTVKSDLGK